MTKERAAKIILDMINGAESTFGHSLSTLEINALKKAYCALNPEPTTNAEHIRAMTDEELSIWLASIADCVTCPANLGDGDECAAFTCDDAWLKWLREEYKNE